MNSKENVLRDTIVNRLSNMERIGLKEYIK